ncbi:hypothetical protein ETT65_09490 [Streptococcus pyogenes]|nr:hypothetical protein ETT65_09490 [Streptococcus pyogenes]
MIFFVYTFLKKNLIFFKPQVVKSSATSSSITRVPEVKLFGIAQTGMLRIAIEEVVLGAH